MNDQIRLTRRDVGTAAISIEYEVRKRNDAIIGLVFRAKSTEKRWWAEGARRPPGTFRTRREAVDWVVRNR